MASGIVGREEELAGVRSFVEQTEGVTAALVLEGEPGIGKSTLWSAGVDQARERGFRVLSSRPAEAEHGLAHAGLGDLFDGALEDVLPALTPPRRRALEVALLIEEASGDPVDRRALAVAVRGALEALSAREPVLIAIDDVQWLDPSSAGALAFALRRLDAADVRLLLARRVDEDIPAWKLEAELGADRVRRLPVGSLSVGAVHRLLSDRLDRTFARQTLLRIHERSGGNPFFALELGRALEAEVDPLEPLPVPETLEELVRARLTELPASTREALALASAYGTTAEALLERAGVPAEILEPALAANVIEREHGTVRFVHPLMASVLYRDLGDERRAVHRRIAEVAEDTVIRARHLALSRDEPDAGVALALDDAAKLAAGRGASALEAELAEQALRLTPSDELEARHRRALAAARAHQSAGEWTRARMIAVDLLAEDGIGSVRADALVLLADLEGPEQAVALLEEAYSEAGSRPALQSVVQRRLAWATRFREGFVGALEHAHAALAIAEELDDDALRAGALVELANLGSIVGDAEAPAYAERGRQLATAVGDEELLREAVEVSTGLHEFEDVGRARAAFEQEYRYWRDRDEPWSAVVLFSLAFTELWDGRWQLAAQHAAEARDTAAQYGLEKPQDYLPIAWVAAHLGQLERARRISEHALELAETQMGLHPPMHLGLLGFVTLWGGDAHTAADWLDQADRQAARLGWGEPCNRLWTADHVEALLEIGRTDDALRVLGVWERDAVRLGRKWVLAHVRRCRGLVAAAEGDVDQAVRLLDQATDEHEAVGDRFGRARALLALGTAQRRARKKRAARDAIREALALFEELGAASWVEKARAELGTIGGRTREEGLTPAELRVAALVAEGRTNKEVAAELFLGERTVATHLTHIYAKLGIRSRTELARRLTGEPAERSKVQTF
jgi:DNA-binding CsgD family transcriptional regulator